jgi:tuftelin-interacting protein 11
VLCVSFCAFRVVVEIARLQQIRMLVDEIGAISKTLSSAYEVSLEPFTEPFEKLLYEFKEEYVTMDLDEVVVGAMAPVVRSTSFTPSY